MSLPSDEGPLLSSSDDGSDDERLTCSIRRVADTIVHGHPLEARASSLKRAAGTALRKRVVAPPLS